jgi:hypothetical protein
MSRLVLTIALASLILPSIVLAETPEQASEEASEASTTAADTSSRQFHRDPPSLRYTVLDSKIFLHGFVTSVFSDFGADFPRDEVPPGQLLVSPTDKSSFQYDWALFVGTNVSDSVRVLVETHFVSSPGGSFKPDIVTTEANVTFSPFESDALRLSMGQYWAPFGLVTDDWYSAENLFALVPEAAKAFPSHYTERGLKVEGQKAFDQGWGLNYAFSVGNGVGGVAISDQHSFDQDDNKAVIGRLGLFPGTSNLEIGFSVLSGTFRGEGDPGAAIDDPGRYAADFDAYGLDAVYKTARFELRGYWISSTEDLLGAQEIDREGLMLEGSWVAYEGFGLVTSLEPKIRFDWVERDRLFGTPLEDEVIAVGLDIWLRGLAVLRVDYFLHDEGDQRDLDRNGIAIRLTGVF